jgi:hypothetical protein
MRSGLRPTREHYLNRVAHEFFPTLNLPSCFSLGNHMSVARLRSIVSTLLTALPLSAWCGGPVVVAESLKIGDTVTGPLKIGRRIITLPSGTWQVIASAERPVFSDAGRPGNTLRLHFQEVRNERLTRGLEVVATKYSPTSIRWNEEPCKTKGDSFWVEHRRSWIHNSINDQFCMRVGYMSNIVDGATGAAFEAWARDIKAKSIGYPPEAPFVSITRFTSFDYLRMSIYFDPMLSGIGPSQNPVRQLNDWHGDTASQRPAHANFYAALVAWAPKFADAVQRAFDGDEKLVGEDFGEPNLPSK